MIETLQKLDELRDIREQSREETNAAIRRVNRSKTSAGRNIATDEMLKAIAEERLVDDAIDALRSRGELAETFNSEL